MERWETRMRAVEEEKRCRGDIAELELGKGKRVERFESWIRWK